MTFDDLSDDEELLPAQYPVGLITAWSQRWRLSGPWDNFTTNSIYLNGDGQVSGTFRLAAGKRLESLVAYNGSSGSGVVTLACSGQATKQVTVAARQIVTVQTGWTAGCSDVTVSSGIGDWINFDDLVIR